MTAPVPSVRAAGVAAAEGGVRLDEVPPGAALGEQAADAAGGDRGVLFAGGVDRLHGHAYRQGVAHRVYLVAQHGVLRLPHGQGGALVRGLGQPQHGQVLLRVIVHQIGLRLVVLVKEHVQLAAAQGFARQDKVLHHVAVGDDVLGVLALLAHEEAGALPIGHGPVRVRRAGADENDAVQHALLEGGRGGEHAGSHQHCAQRQCG